MHEKLQSKPGPEHPMAVAAVGGEGEAAHHRIGVSAARTLLGLPELLDELDLAQRCS